MKLAICFALLGFLALPARAADRHVVIAIIDGPRASEFLDEPGRPHVPVLDGVLIPQGSVVADFRNLGVTNTLPGHAATLTGTAQPIANDGSERPTQPTLFERIRKEQGLGEDAVWLFGGKDKITALTYSTHPDYGVAYRASVDATLRDDAATFAAAQAVLTQPSPPVLTCINFSRVDLAGHSGVWADYLAAIAIADSLAGELWTLIQATPALAGKTDLFITSDHGRHLDAFGGFQNHGDGCDGCRKLPFVAIGPDIKSGHVSSGPGRQEDIAATVRYVLELGGPVMEGFVLSDILVSFTQTGLPDRPTPPASPALAAWPNPFTGRVAVTAPGWAPVRVQVLDVRGGVLLDERVSPDGVWSWSGRLGSGRAAPPGIYWLRMADSVGLAASVRVLRLP